MTDTYTRMTAKICPKCGSCLMTDGDTYWCAYVRCDFGLDEEIHSLSQNDTD